MVYLKPLSGVTQNELQAVGYRIQDLAVLHQHQVAMPHAFAVLSNAMDEIIRLNNLKYKIDYILSHAQLEIASSLQNTYSGVRKAMLEAKLPPGFEVELREFYESITTPLSIGELTAERPPVRIIMSMNRLDDPENNDVIIQNVNTFEELLIGLREAWGLVYHPSILEARLRERFPESQLKTALLVQTMDEPTAAVHTYSSLPQDHKKVYVQAYYGYPDLREKVIKDYYAISKDGLRVVASQVQQQPSALARNESKELVLAPIAPTSGDKLTDRNLIEISRLTKKAERLIHAPVKAFFTIKDDAIEILWVNRLGFDILIGDEQSTQEPTTPAIPAADETEKPAGLADDDFIVIPESSAPADQAAEDQTAEQPAAAAQPAAEQPAQPSAQVSAKLLNASLRIVHQVVERKYRSTFSETDVTGNLADQINRLNSSSVFSRPVDGALLLQAEEAARNESHISEEEYAKAIEEVAFLMTYA